ncbi:MAG TPA: DUF2231 domain-containing protein [Ktedonobacteraceae bacterium]|nr:DUF2231 domain-containing protein [Ktedonobacteraceae bacterium]
MASKTTTQTNRPTSWVETPPSNPPLHKWSSELIAHMPWLDKLAEPLQNWLVRLYGKPGEPSYRAKDFLNGVWLGHVLHPTVVQLPLGAWTAATILDQVWLSKEDDGLARGSDLLLWVGLASSLSAVVTGLTNWADVDGPEKRAGLWHGILNGSAGVLNLTSAILRLAGQRRLAIALSSTAFVGTVYSAYIGGDLAYSSAIGVNHTAQEGGPDKFFPVMNEADLVPGKLTRVVAEGVPVVLMKDGNTICALAATCSHLGGPLDEGSYQDGVVYCPWHNSGFHMCDGSVANSPAVYPQPAFAVRTRNGKIEVRRLEHV